MKNWRLKQISVSLLIVLSLFVSSAAACACAHHQPETEAESPACHQAAHDETESQNAPETAAAQSIQGKHSLAAACECFSASVPKVYGKGDTLKIEKHLATVSAAGEMLRRSTRARAPAAARFAFAFFRLSDSNDNLKSPRAPPRA